MVKTARDGRFVQKAAGPLTPHLIVVDLMMPGGGGYELIRTLQSNPATNKTPVLIITGATLDHSTRSMLEREPNVKGFIEKPLHPYSFLNKVHAILNTQSKEEKMMEERAREMKKFEPDKFEF